VTLLRRVLEGISDTRLLSDHKDGPSPLRLLIKAYSAKAEHNDNAPNVTPTFTGADLKDGIEKLEPECQIELLHEYLVAAKKISPSVSEEEVEDRKIWRLAIKLVMFTTAVIVILLVGAGVAIAVRRGELNVELLKNVLEFITDVIETIAEK
jgi:hypothetical protein